MNICVFCESSPGKNSGYISAATQMGELLAQRGLTLIYGGWRIGLMGAVADSTMQNGGKVIGIIPEFLATKEVAHNGLTILKVVESMHERKLEMVTCADAFITMPGGFGDIRRISRNHYLETTFNPHKTYWLIKR